MNELFSDLQAVGASFPAWTDQPDPRRLLRERDPEIYSAIELERRRQTNGIELIASENYVFPEVLAAAGSVLTNKYAEGYPGRRYYGGCQYVDIAEKIAIERALGLFGAEHANVQPHSGAQANAAVYMALLEPGDTVLAMKLEPRRPFEPWIPSEQLWPLLQLHPLWPRSRNRAARLRHHASDGNGTPTQTAPGGRQRLPRAISTIPSCARLPTKQVAY